MFDGKSFAISLALLCLWVAPVGADTIVYNNGPINGNVEAYNFSGYAVTDSFTLSQPTALSEAEIGTWAPSGAPTGLDWSIGSTPFGSQIGSGIASLTSTATGGLGFGSYPLYESTFTLTGKLAAGTYWISLTNTSPAPVYWDEDNGPSTAYQSGSGSVGSESFQIYGTPALSTAAVPLPNSACALAALMGAAGLVCLLQSRRARLVK